MKKIPQDIIGNIAILKFPKRTLWITKKLKAKIFLNKTPKVTTVLEKTEKFSGKFRILKTKHLAGIRTKEAIYRENSLTFKFNIDKTYFSPRLSNERKVISEEIYKIVKKNKNPKILVMFSGVSPYSLVIAKKFKEKKKKAIIYSNELNKDANTYSKENIRINKLENYIKLIPGNAKDLPKKLKEKFDIILMTRPNIKETFLKSALKLSKKGTTIFYHGFGTKEVVIKEIKDNCKNPIGKITIRKAGDIGPYVYRWQAKFKVK
ncbi:MAG: hypothetical protein IH845_02885 [Nanoarchaeota archaeon]|nr:hypothetical protein [Nanoarchaeota archaeon]